MKLWKISQTENGGHDTFDAAIVAAETAEDARNTSPGGFSDLSYCWASRPELVDVRCIGEASYLIKAGVILASFNAG